MMNMFFVFFSNQYTAPREKHEEKTLRNSFLLPRPMELTGTPVDVVLQVGRRVVDGRKTERAGRGRCLVRRVIEGRLGRINAAAAVRVGDWRWPVQLFGLRRRQLDGVGRALQRWKDGVERRFRWINRRGRDDVLLGYDDRGSSGHLRNVMGRRDGCCRGGGNFR